ncbi:STAS domain-containing protein [Petroclostridium sp. X23]|uniref:STAS domain-containing protein n=1 Tax=Petroclostridium sp. X23 TaxID=3045146 RepID=UPI0024ADC802|nr:STAS domain-containing protein [Petroclostridium sp. X23]WHH61543.1 STAS domain-containing protein [Petroclostridium sp. X23]
MVITAENRNDRIRIKVPQNFAIKEVDQFRKQMYDLINAGEKAFDIDFSQCSFIDSAGLGVLISIYKKCMEKGGSLKLYSLQPEVMRIFTLTRLDKVFEILPQCIVVD